MKAADELRNLMHSEHLSSKALAERIGVSAAHLSDVTHGRRRISMDMAFKLGDVFGQTEVYRYSAEYWLATQLYEEIDEYRAEHCESKDCKHEKTKGKELK